jgi:hypothetical protein
MNRFCFWVVVAATWLPSLSHAAPNCWGVEALNPQNKKVIRITCSDDHAPGTAPQYACTFNWKIKTVDGAVHNVTGNFTVVRNESDVLKYEESRIEGKDIDDEVEGISISCHAQ